MGDEVVLEVFRLDPERETAPHMDVFRVPSRPGLTVLEALFEVLERQDPSLSFRYACRGAVCGSCAMYINGSYRLACETQVSSLTPGKITIHPLPHLPVIKDLVVDMTAVFEKYAEVMLFLQAQDSSLARERLQSPAQRRILEEKIGCILCGACFSACPMTWTNKDYVGPAALNAAYRFVADSRDGAVDERLALVSSEEGLWRCHTVFNCTEACPKKVNPAHSIQQLKRISVARRMRALLPGVSRHD